VASADYVIVGDAKGEIATRPDSLRTEAVREAFVDRAQAVFARHIEDFRSHVIARRADSPADLETMNVNLVGGDPYGGCCDLDQFFVGFAGSIKHRTAVPGVYDIGASTHPGPGLGGGSGFLLANTLK
jgi:phytoene dehydrogenase-like protein